jgi:hypothetical protein
MATQARFLKAADSSRPYKGHRYDPFGPKVERTVTLFGRAQLEAWVALESNPNVIAYCERPLVIPELSPKRLVDFWVGFRDREELWLLQPSNRGLARGEPAELLPAFVSWASANGMNVRFIPDAPDEKMRFLDNWGRIIRELTTNRRFISKALCAQVHSCLRIPLSLGDVIERFAGEDPVLVRAAVYSLVHAGKVKCLNIDQQPLGVASIMEAT